MSTRYYFRLSDPKQAGDRDPDFAFRSQGAEGQALELQDALRNDALFQRWRARQDEPDDVDPGLGVTDPQASVEGQQRDLHIELAVTTAIPGSILKHRLRLLAGNGWTLRDVKAG